MQLTNEKIQEVTCGAVRFTQEEGGIRFWRFTEAQEELYKAYREELDCSFHTKTFTASNVRLVFKTDSAKLGMEMAAEMIAKIKDEKLCDGVHIMAIGAEKNVPVILDKAGIAI